MKLSIITVNYRSWEHLQKALDSLHPGFPQDWEIIVIDNESLPEPFNEFQERYPWVTFVANERNSGFGVGCNLGAARASGENLLFMNPDVVATTENLRSLMRVLEQYPEISLLSPRQVDANGRPQKVSDEFPDLWNQSKTLKALFRILWPSRFGNARDNHAELTFCDWITGSCLLISRKNFDAIGGWSDDYWMYVEDTDICRKARDSGMGVACASGVQVMHVHGGSSRINVEVKAMTKLEVIISKHVYTDKYFRGVRRKLMHLLIAMLRIPMLIIATLLDLLTLRLVPALRVRSKMLSGLLKYYAGVMTTGSWLSPRARENQVA